MLSDYAIFLALDHFGHFLGMHLFALDKIVCIQHLNKSLFILCFEQFANLIWTEHGKIIEIKTCTTSARLDGFFLRSLDTLLFRILSIVLFNESLDFLLDLREGNSLEHSFNVFDSVVDLKAYILEQLRVFRLLYFPASCVRASSHQPPNLSAIGTSFYKLKWVAISEGGIAKVFLDFICEIFNSYKLNFLELNIGQVLLRVLTVPELLLELFKHLLALQLQDCHRLSQQIVSRHTRFPEHSLLYELHHIVLNFIQLLLKPLKQVRQLVVVDKLEVQQEPLLINQRFQTSSFTALNKLFQSGCQVLRIIVL